MSDIEKQLRAKIDSNGDNPDPIISKVKENPDFFVWEGGGDGTFSHATWLDEYGDYKPEIIQFAEECGGEV
ncbi:MAG: hypothetical protein ACW99G_02580 [Candidatus Thorarchaeota archaeon]|jgi:hypothetical protein